MSLSWTFFCKTFLEKLSEDLDLLKTVSWLTILFLWGKQSRSQTEHHGGKFTQNEVFFKVCLDYKRSYVISLN